MKEKVKDVIIKLLKVKPSEVKEDVSLQDSIGVDSTEMVELVIALEKAFGVKVTAKEVTKTSSVSDIAKLLLTKGAKA